MPMQYTEVFKVVKNENFQWNFFFIFLIFAQNIDCGYTLEYGSNEYPQSMFWIKNKKNRYTPVFPIFFIEKLCLRGYTLHGHVFLVDGENYGLFCIYSITDNKEIKYFFFLLAQVKLP